MATKRRATPTKSTGLTYAVTPGSKNGARRTIVRGLVGFNREKAPFPNWKSFAVVLNDKAGKVVGGLYGHTGWGWMYVELFWLPETLRGKGYGRNLMKMAEAEAVKRGCVGMYLNTASFQAPGFYRKLGFKQYAVIEDFPPGHRNHYFMKRLKP